MKVYEVMTGTFIQILNYTPSIQLKITICLTFIQYIKLYRNIYLTLLKYFQNIGNCITFASTITL